MQTETVVVPYRESGKKNQKPVTIEWKGEKLIRNHSLRSSVKQIVRMSQSLDVVKINLIGDMSSGKSWLAQTLAHLIHKISEDEYKTPFAIRLFNKDDLLDFQATLKNLSPANYILIFDDVAWLSGSATKHQIDVVKQALSIIRHIPGGEGCKIITMMCFQYSFGLDKFIRNTNFHYFTSCGSVELENYEKICGVKYHNKFLNFRKLYNDGHMTGKFRINLGRRGRDFVYPFRKPFQPNLFYDSSSLRLVVSPSRDWLDKLCSVCSNSKKEPMKGGIDVEEFANDLTRKFGVGTARSAIRLKMHLNGMAVWPKRFQQCLRYIDQYMANKTFNFQELMNHYKFKSEATRLDEKLPEEIISS